MRRTILLVGATALVSMVVVGAFGCGGGSDSSTGRTYKDAAGNTCDEGEAHFGDEWSKSGLDVSEVWCPASASAGAKQASTPPPPVEAERSATRTAAQPSNVCVGMTRLRRDVAQFQQIDFTGGGWWQEEMRVSLKAIRGDVTKARSYASPDLVRQLVRFEKSLDRTSKMVNYADSAGGWWKETSGRIMGDLGAFTSSWKALAAAAPQCHLPDVPGGVVSYG